MKARPVCPTCKRTIPRSSVGETPLARALFKMRESLHYTKREAAKAARVDLATYHRVEAGKDCDVATFYALCRWANERMEDMLPPRPKRRATATPRSPQAHPGAP